jgi:drug/metabolite transporter (DMT)-like permease
VVAVVWGSSYLAAQRAAVVLGVLPVLALRFGIAALALTAVCLVSNRWRPTRVELGLGFLLGGSQAAVLASLVMGTEPLWAVLTGTVLAGEVLGPVAATGAACVLLGTAWGQRIELRHRTAASPTADPVAA